MYDAAGATKNAEDLLSGGWSPTIYLEGRNQILRAGRQLPVSFRGVEFAMKGVHLSLVLGIAVVGIAYLVFSFDPGRAKPSADPAAPQAQAKAEWKADFVVGEPIIFGNLAIFPVSSTTPRSTDRFITLDEGLKAGTVEIFEKGAAGVLRQVSEPNPIVGDDPFATTESQSTHREQANLENLVQELDAANEVNELMVVNRSERPLYLMPGEIIIGGDQDRTIGQELVIAPDGKPVPIEVFCVEHGRWGGRDEEEYARIVAQGALDDETNAAAIAVADLVSVSATAETANSGKFVGSVGSLNKSARLAVQKGDGQNTVWDEVAKENARAGVETQTGTFASNYSDAESLERLEPYLNRFRQPIAEARNIVGVIVAVNGDIESMDVFESTPLFHKLWPKLLKSYALDASNAENDAPVDATATRADAIAFFEEISEAQANDVVSTGAVALSQRESDRVLLFSAHAPSMEEVGGPGAAFGGGIGGFGGGGFGGAVHASGFSK